MKNKKIIKELMVLAIACLLYSLSVVLFIDPAQIIPGSVTGVGVVLKAAFGFPIGLVSIIINVPLLIFGYSKLGKKFLIYTVLTVILTSTTMDLFANMKPFTNNIMLASIFGGIIMGIGLGMILKLGSSTGGTTVVGRLVTRKRPSIPIGDILLIVDFIIIVLGSVVLKNSETLLYSIINLYICVKFINIVDEFEKRRFEMIIFTKIKIEETPLNEQIEKFDRNNGYYHIYCKKNKADKIFETLRSLDAEIEAYYFDVKKMN
ncbi:hypothetical protein HKO22_08350 [Peptoniphilus sp. AGMB00490]|uniref:BCR, YitT family n=1 Tax=Peptoniphilus faecalis TaxID=2731255 RepID=A0A848RNM8_9FIRM|nr:YitT family protein [Peptoniphilus faecalis]NMW85744.1 hypothetical protein [Peptoniphilus faecalis]